MRSVLACIFLACSVRPASVDAGTVRACDAGECGGSCVDTSRDPANCGSCGHDCCGGECDRGSCQPALIAADYRPTDIAVDKASVYWTSYGDDWSVQHNGAVRSVALNAGAPTTLAAKQLGPGPIVIDAASVYWANIGSREILSVPLAGGATTKLTWGGAWSLALDSRNVFWATGVVIEGGLHYASILSVPLSGGQPVQIPSVTDGQVVALAADAMSLYWTDALGAVMSVPLGGPDGMGFRGAKPTKIAEDKNGPAEIAIDSVNVYWTNNNAVMKAPLRGGTPTMLASAPMVPTRLAVHADRAYWTSGGPKDDGAVMSVPINGGIVTTLATNQLDPGGIAVDSKCVYWVNTDRGDVWSGAIMKVATPTAR